MGNLFLETQGPERHSTVYITALDLLPLLIIYIRMPVFMDTGSMVKIGVGAESHPLWWILDGWHIWKYYSFMPRDAKLIAAHSVLRDEEGEKVKLSNLPEFIQWVRFSRSWTSEGDSKVTQPCTPASQPAKKEPFLPISLKLQPYFLRCYALRELSRKKWKCNWLPSWSSNTESPPPIPHVDLLYHTSFVHGCGLLSVHQSAEWESPSCHDFKEKPQVQMFTISQAQFWNLQSPIQSSQPCLKLHAIVQAFLFLILSDMVSCHIFLSLHSSHPIPTTPVLPPIHPPFPFRKGCWHEGLSRLLWSTKGLYSFQSQACPQQYSWTFRTCMSKPSL